MGHEAHHTRAGIWAMQTRTTVYLLRHAESQAAPHIPEPDWPLSARGRQQAERLHTCLAPLAIDVIYSSPYARAVATVTPFAQATGHVIERVEDLRERKLTPKPVENWLEVVKQSWRDFDFAFPHCESSVQCQARMVRTLSHLVQGQEGKVLLVSSHGNAMALYLHALDAAYSFDHWAAMRNPELFRIYYNGVEPVWDDAFTWEVSTSTSQNANCVYISQRAAADPTRRPHHSGPSRT